MNVKCIKHWKYGEKKKWGWIEKAEVWETEPKLAANGHVIINFKYKRIQEPKGERIEQWTSWYFSDQ